MTTSFQKHFHSTLEHFGANKGIQWLFNCPSAAHMGGVWEKMLHVVKRVSHATAKDAHLSHDPKVFAPFTLNHLSLKQMNPSPPVFPDSNAYHLHQIYIKHLAHQFWSLFVCEYLPELKKISKWTKPNRDIELYEFVLIAERHLPPYFWPSGSVVKVNPGHDGWVRSVLLKNKSLSIL